MKHKKLDRGSAFVMAMVALAVLTVVGLSLSMVTETESLLGETEKVINEQFFAAESGGTAQTATLLATNGLEGINLVVPSVAQTRSQSGLQIGYDVVSSGLAPIDTDEMPYTKVNEGRGDKLFAYYYHMKTLARRTAWAKTVEVPTCAEINANELGRTLTQTSFYYAPANKLPDTALITMQELDNSGSSGMPNVISSNSDCYAEVFSNVSGTSSYPY